MHRPIITILLLSVVLLACGANDKETTPADPIDASTQKAPGKANGDQEPSAQKTAKADTAPACMHCGATCGLAAICVCEPGTKKQSKVEFDVECEPICIAGCSSRPWPLGNCGSRVGCTNGCEDRCRCPSRVRSRKQLTKETVDEDVPTIKRKVAYVCDCCAGRCAGRCPGRCPGRCTGGGCKVTPCLRPSSWWTRLGWW